MRESVKIILQCIERLPKGPVKSIDGKISPPNRADLKQSMEALIHHFKLLLKDTEFQRAMYIHQLKHPKVNLEYI